MLEVDAAAHQAQVVAGAVEDRLRDENDQVVRRRDVRAGNHRATFTQGGEGAFRLQCLAEDLQGVGRGGTDHALGVGDDHRIEGVGLQAQSDGFTVQVADVVEMLGQQLGGVGQLLLGRLQVGLGAGGQLGGVGVIGFQGVVDEQLVLHAIAGVEAVEQGDQRCDQGQQQDQAAQVPAEEVSELHRMASIWKLEINPAAITICRHDGAKARHVAPVAWRCRAKGNETLVERPQGVRGIDFDRSVIKCSVISYNSSACAVLKGVLAVTGSVIRRA